ADAARPAGGVSGAALVAVRGLLTTKLAADTPTPADEPMPTPPVMILYALPAALALTVSAPPALTVVGPPIDAFVPSSLPERTFWPNTRTAIEPETPAEVLPPSDAASVKKSRPPVADTLTLPATRSVTLLPMDAFVVWS